jgi:hypothetical protein
MSDTSKNDETPDAPTGRVFYKVVNTKEGHNELFYKVGWNKDSRCWNPRGSCQPGGIYYTDKVHLDEFHYYGESIAEVVIPQDVPIYDDPGGKKYKSPKKNYCPQQAGSSLEAQSMMNTTCNT